MPAPQLVLSASSLPTRVNLSPVLISVSTGMLISWSSALPFAPQVTTGASPGRVLHFTGTGNDRPSQVAPYSDAAGTGGLATLVLWRNERLRPPPQQNAALIDAFALKTRTTLTWMAREADAVIYTRAGLEVSVG